ncbi:hypothetical protein HMPREF9624_01655 [Oribacterium asaccharolyticum ACB7]|uniref:LicD/FKTN/FKRP nucleotidyltransferase domain-containing protein n=1 Tax=Oribacterium asaccharolyticum ACB7 TaxID=796944 RepID=G9WRD9_9FIRM|nr:hypothetical protein HMPREF9624_01655 [Oribacterium asaccharolyticum ACB7]
MELKREFFYEEVQDGFYIPSIMKRAWGAGLTILSEVDRICRKYEIPYYAGYGTLLGAVRSSSFIPWDDDIDLMMLRSDFNRFLSVAEKELPEELALDSLETNPDFWGMNPCVRSAVLCFHPKLFSKYREFPYHAFVDIFPLDELAEDPEEERQRENKVHLLFQMMKKVEGREGEPAKWEEELKQIEKLFSVQLDRRRSILTQLSGVMDRVYQEFNGRGGNTLTFMPLYMMRKDRYPRAVFEKREWAPFCNLSLPIPSGYDRLLQCTYGDYHKKVKAGGEHDYPYFKEKEQELAKMLGRERFFSYTFKKEDLERPKVQSFRDLTFLTADYLLEKSKSLAEQIQRGNASPALSELPLLQETAISLGTAIEQKKGKEKESVSILERYCEALYEAYLTLQEGPSGDASGELVAEQLATEQVAVEQIAADQLIKAGNCLKNLKEALERDCKRQVVFLPHSAKHFASLRPLIDALQEREDTEVKLMPIPYFDRMGDGSLSEMHYEGEDFPKEYPITDYRSYNFAAELPDCIVMNSPYDAFNPVWSVDPFFYSEKLKQYTNKLVYIPWFVTDEIDPENPEDGKAFYNMRYYVTVPGVFHADYTIVQSEEMREAYLEKISRFLEGEEENLEGKAENGDSLQRKDACLKERSIDELMQMMQQKILGAGSCLLGEKEGQGTKEVVMYFLQLLSK